MKKFLKINILYKNKPSKSLESVLELNITKIRKKRLKVYKLSEKNLNLNLCLNKILFDTSSFIDRL